jgi:thymidylate kinase
MVTEQVKHTYPHIIIEGNSGSGKSTLGELARQQSTVVWIPEYWYYQDQNSGRTFPQFPPANVDAIIATNDVWVNMDTARYGELKARLTGPGQIGIIERSVLSLLGVENAKRQACYPFDTADIAARYINLITLGLMPLPHGYVYLTAPADVLSRRVKERNGSTPDFFVNRTTIAAVDSFMRDFQQMVPQERFLLVDTAEMSSAEVQVTVNQFAQKVAEFREPDPSIVALLSGIVSNNAYEYTH